jgi:hypothetical protein
MITYAKRQRLQKIDRHSLAKAAGFVRLPSRFGAEFWIVGKHEMQRVPTCSGCFGGCWERGTRDAVGESANVKLISVE